MANAQYKIKPMRISFDIFSSYGNSDVKKNNK